MLGLSRCTLRQGRMLFRSQRCRFSNYLKRNTQSSRFLARQHGWTTKTLARALLPHCPVQPMSSEKDNELAKDARDLQTIVEAPSRIGNIKDFVVKLSSFAAFGIAGFMVVSGVYNAAGTLLKISPATYLNVGFLGGVTFVGLIGLMVFRYRASTFIRPEKLYSTVITQIENDANCRRLLGNRMVGVEDQVRVYAVTPSSIAGFFKPTSFDLIFRVGGNLHCGIAAVIAQQSAWTGAQKINSLAVHVQKDAPETILLEGSLEEAETVRSKLQHIKNEFHDLAEIPEFKQIYAAES